MSHRTKPQFLLGCGEPLQGVLRGAARELVRRAPPVRDGGWWRAQFSGEVHLRR
jgi:hypothetical protein